MADEAKEHEQRHVVKLQLTRGALEKLVGDSPELQLQLSQQVVEHVLKKHVLKNVESNPFIAQAIKAIEAEGKQLVAQRFGASLSSWGTVVSFSLPVELKTQINTEVEKLVSRKIDELLNLAETQVLTQLEGRVQARVDQLVSRMVREKVEAALKAIQL